MKNDRRYLLSLVLLLSVGCYPEKSQSPTTGTLHVRIAESVAPPVIRQINEFIDVYGERGAKIHYEVVTSVEAVRSYVQDSIQLSVAVDSLTSEEHQIVDEMDGSFLVRVAAYDGVAVIVHPAQNVEIIRTTQLRDMLNGRITQWSQITRGSSNDRIQIVLQPGSDISRFLERTVMGGSSVSAEILDAETSLDVMTIVSQTTGALGFVGTAWLDSAQAGFRQPDIFMDHPEEEAWYEVPEEAREFAYSAHQAHILRGYYPLRRKVFLLSRAALGGDLATGFGAFVLNSEGQRIFFEAKMIPATQNIRLQ